MVSKIILLLNLVKMLIKVYIKFKYLRFIGDLMKKRWNNIRSTYVSGDFKIKRGLGHELLNHKMYALKKFSFLKYYIRHRDVPLPARIQDEKNIPVIKID